MPKERDSIPIPRGFSVMRKDLVNHGYTPGCPGCYAAANDRKRRQHTAACRERIAEALSKDENEAHRISDAKEREDAFMEDKIRESDRREPIIPPEVTTLRYLSLSQ